jgi:hypothetical protein
MNRLRFFDLGLLLFLIVLLVGCTGRTKIVELVIELPEGFSGEVSIRTGVPHAPRLKAEGQAYVVAVPSDGHIETSTIPEEGISTRFRNSGTGRIWGYDASLQKTGDGIPVSGSIEFFVGTKEQYEMQEAHKHKSEFFHHSEIRVQ